ncbi:MAG: sulfotransferase [Bacteroidetes bacterium]|nr:sulfotransferase [Bacteroidota bacterium]
MPKIPIFIIGINPRSGTNYLHQLLALHPDCDYAKHYGEDFILYHADKIVDYYQSVTYHWNPEWGNDKMVFRKALESGLISYLDPGNTTAKYLVTKTPHPENAKLFLEVFSKGYMIIIVRRGQDLVESYIKTFNKRFADSVRGWKLGATNVLDVINDKQIMDSGRVICIKYEDLYTKNEEVMSNLFDFLKMDKSKFDFEKSQNFHVIGSSSYKGNSEKVTWEPIPKNDTFNPLGRFSNWTKFKHFRFNKLAGKNSKALGYELYHESSNPIFLVRHLMLLTYDFFFRIYRRTKMEVNGSIKSKSDF